MDAVWSEWQRARLLPSSFVKRDSVEAAQTFRGLRMSHDGSLALGDRVNIRYGADLIMAGFAGTTTSVRPRARSRNANLAEVASIASRRGSKLGRILRPPVTALCKAPCSSSICFPRCCSHNGRSVLEGDLHEELAVEHDIDKRSTITAAVFNDQSSNTAVFGRDRSSGPDYLPDFFSNVFAYDGGSMHSGGARLAYTRKVNDNMDIALIYAYAGALAPDANSPDEALRDELSTQFRHSAAAKFSAKVPRSGTTFTTSYKWTSGPAVSQQDAYGQSMYHIDPYLSIQVRQRLPELHTGPCRDRRRLRQPARARLCHP